MQRFRTFVHLESVRMILVASYRIVSSSMSLGLAVVRETNVQCTMGWTVCRYIECPAPMSPVIAFITVLP